jgi:hypothetical protein
MQAQGLAEYVAVLLVFADDWLFLRADTIVKIFTI